MAEWIVERWDAEVAHRPIENIYRRTLDATWRQVYRWLTNTELPRMIHVAGDPPPRAEASPAPSTCYIWSAEHRQFWRPGGEGYTPNISDAGLYSLFDARHIWHECGPEKGIVLLAEVDARKSVPEASPSSPQQEGNR